MGSETEFTCAGSEGVLGDSIASSEHVIDQRSAQWLKNGGRLYIDHDAIVEYATPECNSAHQLTLYELAGNEIVEAAVPRDTPVYKRSSYEDVEVNGCRVMQAMSAGHHENFSSGIDTSYWGHRYSLGSYLATRAIWAGAGIVTDHGYELYQKRNAMNFLDPGHGSYTSHGNKQLFKDKQDRLELRAGDGNMSPWVITQKFAFTSLVLRLIEHDKFPEDLIIQGLAQAALLASSDPLEKIRTHRGTYSSVSHQQAIARAGLEFADTPVGKDIPSEEVVAAQEVLRACEDVEEYLCLPDSLYNITDRIDWAAKLETMIRQGFTKNGISTSNLDAVRHDIQWEKIGKNSASRRWYNKYSQFDTHLISSAMFTPPGSRAEKRTEYLQYLVKSDQTVVFSDWSSVRTDTETRMFDDPYGIDEALQKRVPNTVKPERQ